jgi:hypothetical protein
MKILFLITFIAFILISCDLFTARDAETPDQARSNYQTPVQASIVIDNLKNSLSDKNVQNYMASFVDSIFSQKKFSFTASSEATSIYQIFLQGWGLNEEQRYISSIFNKVPADFPISLTFSEEIYSNLSGDSLVYSAAYFLNIPASSGDGGTVNYSGNLQFNMLRDSRALWVIYYWRDTKSQSLPSWSELKGSLY